MAVTVSDVFDKKIPSSRSGVQRTPELNRILALPRRKIDFAAGTIDGAPIPDLTSIFATNTGPCDQHPRCPVCASGQARLWPTQSVALLEAERGWGLFAAAGVGSGKTLVTLLLPEVFDAKRVVLLVPASLKNQMLTRDMGDYGRHFRILQDRITVVAYTELSTAATADILERIEPDLIIADEVHSISRFQSARTKRFVRYFRSHPDTRFCGLSGTITRRSLRDYSAISECALRAGSPVPVAWSDLQEWADALDPGDDPQPAGALRLFADPNDPRLKDDPDVARVAIREGYRRRLVETPGVVATSESWEGASLVISTLRPEVPAVVQAKLALLQKTWEIDGEEIDSAMRLVEAKRQIAIGFYYRWCWPNGPDTEWLQARAVWHKAVREILKRSRAGLDSPLLVARAAERKQLDELTLLAWQEWKAVRDRYNPSPPVAPVWLSSFALDASERWAKEQVEASILWYSHEAVGDALAQRGFHVYGSGTDAGEACERVIACSIRAQGTGKNLQKYSRNLWIEPPASGATTEQLLGRTHRPGQQADEVWVDVFAHTYELLGSLHRAVEDAQYVQQTQGQRQKILAARRIGW